MIPVLSPFLNLGLRLLLTKLCSMVMALIHDVNNDRDDWRRDFLGPASLKPMPPAVSDARSLFSYQSSTAMLNGDM